MRASAFTHSFLGHPVMAVLNLIGLRRAAAWVHDVAMPVPAEPAVEPTDHQHPVVFACQVHQLQDEARTLRLEWQEASGSGGGSFARTFGEALGAAKEMAMLLNGERSEARIVPDETCEAWVEREWFWWIVRYRSKPSDCASIMDKRFLRRSSAQVVASVIKDVHRDGVLLGSEG